ncbi:MAG: redoxin domain-containing protein [Planctomycetes bacterium]|nr:redoxin domain-containing protein [Planctomycetota bacterium]
MRRSIHVLVALAALGTVPGPWAREQTPAAAPAAPAPDEAALQAELEALGEEFEAAQRAFYAKLGELYAPYRDREPSEAEAAELERKAKELYAQDPSTSFVPRFAALAKKAPGTLVAAKAWLRVVNIGGDDNAQVQGAVAVLLAEHLERAELTELASALAYTRQPPEFVRSTLGTLRSKSPHPSVQAAATLSLASVLQSEDLVQAKELYRELAAKFAALDAGWGGTYGEIATRALFELEHLQIGMLAPDFEASDENGVKFKVGDYRGKVVVLDFWGFW